MLTTALLAGGAVAAKKAYDWHMREPITGVCVVTGSAGGLGFALCRELILKGADAIVVLDLKQEAVDAAVEKLQVYATDLRRRIRVVGFSCNVADVKQVKATAERIATDVGPVEILINNAGIVSGKPFLELTEEQIRRTFDVNTLALFWTLRAFLPGMVARDRGTVVTISSAGGMVGTNGLADYSASKFAVYGMDESLRLDLRKRGSKVHTLCVCPFYINTGLFDGVQTTPLLPLLEPGPVATAVVAAIVARRHYLELPGLLSLAWVTKVLPTRVRDRLLDAFGVTSSMDDFRGRSKL